IIASESAAADFRTPPAPHAYETHVRGRFDGDLGKNAGRTGFRDTDWVARQMSVVCDQQTMYLTNRFQLVAYNLSNGQQKWMARLGGEQGEAYQWPFVPMRPTLLGD